jgi:hypothetical protein
MRWSKLRYRIESGFAPSLGKRVRLEATRYRKSHDAEGRWAILIDGVEAGGLGCIVADIEQWQLTDEFRLEQGDARVGLMLEAQISAMQKQADIAHHTLPMFYKSVFDFTNMSLEDALGSDDAVQRTLAYVDRRLGKRRLAELAHEAPKTDLERKCLETRLRAEGMEPEWEDENC